MENAQNLKEALDIWFSTNNTLGMNHGIGSGNEKIFVALETMANYTAVIHANSRVEANYYIEKNGELVKLGYPLLDAVRLFSLLCFVLNSYIDCLFCVY